MTTPNNEPDIDNTLKKLLQLEANAIGDREFSDLVQQRITRPETRRRLVLFAAWFCSALLAALPLSASVGDSIH